MKVENLAEIEAERQRLQKEVHDLATPISQLMGAIGQMFIGLLGLTIAAGICYYLWVFYHIWACFQ